MANSTWEWSKVFLILAILSSPDAEGRKVGWEGGRRHVVISLHPFLLPLPSLSSPPSLSDVSYPSKHLIKRNIDRSVSIPSLRWTLSSLLSLGLFPVPHLLLFSILHSTTYSRLFSSSFSFNFFPRPCGHLIFTFLAYPLPVNPFMPFPYPPSPPLFFSL